MVRFYVVVANVLMSWLTLAMPANCRDLPTAPAGFQPDSNSVQRFGPAYRYPQAGWIVLHIEGEPYERGFQHGRLLAPEILAYLRCSAALRSPASPADGWNNLRSLVNALFVRRYEKEYLEEMKGIADGANSAGARFEGRPIDLVDVVGLNAWPEIDTLDGALAATPTGLEGIRFAQPQVRSMPVPKETHCSAFAATGPATADGKIVFGHITMFSLYPSLFYNVWLDIKPSRGHRVFMQTYPAGIQSGLDYYFNDAGILVCETTLAQTRFDIQGMALASRIRQVLQYSESIDQAVDILKNANNGLYTNEWLLGDIKTNEIAMFELGTAKTKLYRSSRNDWFAGTEGFYWGCNNTKDLDVRLETISSVHAEPANMIWHPSDRDKTWLRLYNENKGKINVDFGKLAFTTPPLAAYHSVDAKFTTTDLAREFKTWALYGPPLGRAWKPTAEEARRFPDIRPMVSNPWAILHANPPPRADEAAARHVVDISDRIDSNEKENARRERERLRRQEAAWHGTILPRTEADIWLASAFADFERIASLEKSLRASSSNGTLTARDRERISAALFAYRSAYTASAHAHGDVPLAKTHPAFADNDWYRIVSGKGVLVLNELKHVVGEAKFEDIMEAFGQENAGKEVSSNDFQVFVEKNAGKQFGPFFEYWLKQPGLPALHLQKVSTTIHGKGYQVAGVIRRDDGPPQGAVNVTVETTGGEELTKLVSLDGAETPFTLNVSGRPSRVWVDKYGVSAGAGGGPFSIFSFHDELANTLIIYGTADEASSNKETAENLQRGIVEFRWNYTVPIKSDKEVTEADLKSHHLLLVGRADTNRLVDRFSGALPVTFGTRSFTVRHETFANAGSAVIGAGANPLNRRYSVVVLAGLSAESTFHTPEGLLNRGGNHPEVLVIPQQGDARSFVVPPRELVWEVSDAQARK
jgi:hypothetical protein